MNRGQIKTAVKRYGFSDSDPLDTWVTMAHHEIFMMESVVETLLVGETTIAVPLGGSTLTLPSDFFKVVDLTDETDGVVNPLDYVSYLRFKEAYPDRTTQGVPDVFTTVGLGTVIIQPPSDRARSIRLVYQKVEPEMTTDASTPDPLPAKFHGAVVYKAVAIGLMAENEEERAQTAEAQFDRIMEPIVNLYSTRQAGVFSSVQDVMGYGS